jgi:hypothetical protein
LTEAQQALVPNVNVLEAAEAKITALEEAAAKEITVKSVSAINTTGVDVVIKATTAAMEDVTVEVIDDRGTVIEVTPIDLVEGETIASFLFVRPLGAAPSGVWSVNGVEIDFDFQGLLSDVNTAGDAVALYNALTAIGAQNLLAANSLEYFTALGLLTEDLASLAEVQEFVDGVNQAQVDAGTFADWKADVEAAMVAGNNIQLLALLEQFERVNPDSASAYDTAIDADNNDTIEFTTFAQIQTAIDTANAAAATGLVNAAEAQDATRDDYNDAVAAMAFVAPDEEGVTTKAELQERLVVVDKVLRVFDATTPAQLSLAYNNLVTYVADETTIGTNPFYDAARSTYITELDTAATYARTAAAVETAIGTGNAAAQLAALTTIDGLTAGSTTAQVLTSLQNLDAVTEDTAFDIADVKTDVTSLEAYRSALVAQAWTGGGVPLIANVVTDIGLVNTAIDGVNNPSGISVLDNIYTIAQGASIATTADELWNGTAASSNEGLSDLPAQFNVVEANKVAYFANIAEFASVLTGTADAAEEADAKALIACINTLEQLRAAKTATNARAALSALAFDDYVTGAGYLNTDTSSYIDLSSAQKLEVAEYVMKQTVTNVLGTEMTAIFTTGYVGNYTGLISTVNAAGPAGTDSISDMSAALAAIEYDAFDDLTAQEKMEVAEVVLNAIPSVEESGVITQTDFKLLSEIEAAIDAAIAELGL